MKFSENSGLNLPYFIIFQHSTNFDISITELNLNAAWYSIDDGLTNITLTGFIGTINQPEWDKKGHGLITIRFYANDSFGFESHAEVIVLKDIMAPISSISFIPHEVPNKVNISTIFMISTDDTQFPPSSGLLVIRYKINNSDWIDYIAPFNLSIYSAGYYLITYYSIDIINNLEIENTLLIELVELPSISSRRSVSGYNVYLLIGIVSIISLTIRKIRNKILNYL